jgi:hypothetical protein
MYGLHDISFWGEEPGSAWLVFAILMNLEASSSRAGKLSGSFPTLKDPGLRISKESDDEVAA